MDFKKTDISSLKFNPFDSIGKKWMLITSGAKDNFNTMTASWGQMGVIWNKNVVTCYIRPNRFTYEFIEKNDYFTLSFLGEQHRNALKICGSKSGRDCNKVQEAGITPVEIDNCIAFEEADTVIVCRKLYRQELSLGCFTDKNAYGNAYDKDPVHVQYIAEIVAVYTK